MVYSNIYIYYTTLFFSKTKELNEFDKIEQLSKSNNDYDTGAATNNTEPLYDDIEEPTANYNVVKCPAYKTVATQ